MDSCPRGSRSHEDLLLPEILELRSNAVSQTRPCQSQHDLKQDVSIALSSHSAAPALSAEQTREPSGYKMRTRYKTMAWPSIKRESSPAGGLIGLERMSTRVADKDANVLWRPGFWSNEPLGSRSYQHSRHWRSADHKDPMRIVGPHTAPLSELAQLRATRDVGRKTVRNNLAVFTI